MTAYRSCAYRGTVVHKRLAPKRHAFSYKVFALCLDVDEIDRLDADLRLFSRARWNIMSFHDRDYAAGDGTRVADHVRGVLTAAGSGHATSRIVLLSYPRMMGYAFNPLSVYFAYDEADRLGAVVYEVSNTFGERKSYVIPAQPSDETLRAQRCDKEMYVSPFTHASATYDFHLRPPDESVVVGVDLREGAVPVLKTHFRGDRVPLSDGALARLALTHPLMTAKVVAAIHVEAARLWWKGVPLVARHTSPRYSFTVVETRADGGHHV
jgi:DUF1365 family protein